ncbi:hypothetical protein B9Z55_019290 [Caenorhabditis nigoni]|uniref:Uncharacterized protein n=1 Tax=Caenorhabditis nigoni TaxID=1611254 RepID=A0A2G5TII7_9PELO|nr:hypothetical protein B9Z55_019290 [Caenorhabditis nigoni]
MFNDTLLLDMFEEQPEYMKELVETAADDLSAVMILIYRNMQFEKDVKRMDNVLKPYKDLIRVLARYRSQTLGRIVWRQDVAPYFAGNASEAIQTMKNIHSFD